MATETTYSSSGRSYLVQAFRQRTMGLAMVVWFAAWLLPASIAFWLELSPMGALFATLIVGGILGVVGFVTLNVAAFGLESCVGEEYWLGQLETVVGLSALPHLVIGTLAAAIGAGATGQFGFGVLSAAPGGPGLGYTAVYQLFQSVGEAREVRLLWLIPSLLTVSSSVFVVGAMRRMGANVFKAALVYGVLFLAASTLWAIVGTFLAFVALVLSMMAWGM